MPFDFTDEEYERRHGATIILDDGTKKIWNKITMGWDVTHADGIRTVEYPDHDRMRSDPEAAPIFAMLARRLNRGKPVLRVVK